MGRPRGFDWDEAKRLRASGLSYAKIGELLGVTGTSAFYACASDSRRKRQYAATAAYTEAKKRPCRGGCGVLVWFHQPGRKTSGFCTACLAERRREASALRHGSATTYDVYGCRCRKCTDASSAARQARRQRTAEALRLHRAAAS